jgi:hypothetical protein
MVALLLALSLATIGVVPSQPTLIGSVVAQEDDDGDDGDDLDEDDGNRGNGNDDEGDDDDNPGRGNDKGKKDKDKGTTTRRTTSLPPCPRTLQVLQPSRRTLLFSRPTRPASC